MSDALLDDYQITNYEVPVELIADEYDTYEAAVADIRETVASTILAHGEFDDSDRPGDTAGRSGVNNTDEDSAGRSESDGESPRQFEQTDRDAREYIKRRVTFDEGNLEHELEHDEADIIRVETVTRLAHLEGDGGADG